MLRSAPTESDPFRRLVAIMERLLDPDGCPWDREQSHETLKPYVIEEAYEVCEAIDAGDMDALREELGDVALQVVFHAALARREGRFDIDQVFEEICAKLIRRHPHVFGETQVDGSGEVLRNWEIIKKEEKRRKAERRRKAEGEHGLLADDAHEPSVLDGVPRAMPALNRSCRIQEKAARVGFDWDNIADVWKKVEEEIGELREAAESGDARRVNDEMGDILFALVNLARFLKVHPEEALQATSNKFMRRFRHVERRAREQRRELKDMTLAQMDALWEEAKEKEKEE